MTLRANPFSLADQDMINEDNIDLDDAKKALADIKKKGSMSWEKVKTELGL